MPPVLPILRILTPLAESSIVPERRYAGTNAPFAFLASAWKKSEGKLSLTGSSWSLESSRLTKITSSFFFEQAFSLLNLSVDWRRSGRLKLCSRYSCWVFCDAYMMGWSSDRVCVGLGKASTVISCSVLSTLTCAAAETPSACWTLLTARRSCLVFFLSARTCKLDAPVESSSHLVKPRYRSGIIGT